MSWAALLGNPIKHTLSPIIHREAFKQAGIDGAYIPIQVKEGYLEEVVTGLCFMENLLGFNITIPFKETAVNLMDISGEEVKLIGAVNTVKRGENKLVGFNTDCSGFLQALDEAWGEELESRKVLVLGGGGAARAVIYALHARNAEEITLALRSQFKGEKLKEGLSWASIQTIPFKKEAIEETLAERDLLVNATPIGLKGETMPFSLERLGKNAFVMDLVYNPPITPLLREAKERRLPFCNGLTMLLYQALNSFEIWTGHRVEAGPIKKILLHWEKEVTEDC